MHLDLAHNKLSRSTPQVVYNGTKMAKGNNFPFMCVDDNLINLFTLGQVYEYNLDWHRQTIDLSANTLFGEIPSKFILQSFDWNDIRDNWRHGKIGVSWSL